MCYDFKNSWIERPITHIVTKHVKNYIKIFVDNTYIYAAPDHQFYVPRKNKWVEAQYLTEEDNFLTCCAEFVSINYKEITDQDADVYDITVADYHNFCVSELGINVHNFIVSAAAAAETGLTAFLVSLGVNAVAAPFVAPIVFVGGAYLLGKTLLRSTVQTYEFQESKERPRTEPKNLEEQIALTNAKAGEGDEIMNGKINDPKYPQEEWAKKQYKMKYKNSEAVIHYWEHRITQARHGFKFKT